MRLIIRHRTRYRYMAGTLRATMALRLWPCTSALQSVESWTVTANGEPVDQSPDGRALLSLQPVPEELDLVAEGLVDTVDRAGVLPPQPGDPHPAIWLRDTPLTEPDAAIRALAQSVDDGQEYRGTLVTLHRINRAVHTALAYRSGATSAQTSAAEALAQGSGVCQDHAHLFIACARARGIPARYVVGYVLAGAGEYEQHETHAWAEAHVDDLGWVGFDASNGICPHDRYVRLTTGLDARDASPIRGYVTGGADIGVSADVRITAIDPDDEASVDHHLAAQAQAQDGQRQSQRQSGGGSQSQSQSQSQSRADGSGTTTQAQRQDGVTQDALPSTSLDSDGVGEADASADDLAALPVMPPSPGARDSAPGQDQAQQQQQQQADMAHGPRDNQGQTGR